jgi:phage terminase large subunit GpA-like protein
MTTHIREAAISILMPPPRLSLIEWVDANRRVASGTSASPGQWRTSAQPCAYGPMEAITSDDTHTVTVMAGTQIVKTELLINAAAYFVAQDPSPILFVQPTQSAAEAFAKERVSPTIRTTPQLRELIENTRVSGTENTMVHKAYPGGSLDFVGANSPTDLASRPKRIILCDEIDKYPVSAGAEGDPLKLAEERASTFHAIGRAKFVRTCSPTVKETSRIGREYAASDMRRLFVACPHCDHQQTLSWANVRWDKDDTDTALPDTAAIACDGCGVIWTERERIAALDALATAPGYGWRQTAKFACCGEVQEPRLWNDQGRSQCWHCKQPSAFNGHAGFHVSKLYSKRHRLPELVREFLEAQKDHELLRKFTNTALAELWEPKYSETFDGNVLLARVETYDENSLPEAVKVVTGFCDVQGDRLEVQLVGWGSDEEAWPFLYEVIHLSPAEPKAWQELDILLRRKFTTVTGRSLSVASFGVDTGGHHGAQVLSFCSKRRGRRIFACKGIAGPRPIWPTRASRTKTNHALHLIGVDTAKEAIYSRLAIPAPEPGQRKPGFIHFPVADNFGPEYFEQLNSERRQVRKRMGQPYTVWVQVRARNEALDTLVGALAMRKALPRFIEAGLEYNVSAAPLPQADTDTTSEQQPSEDAHQALALAQARARQAAQSNWIGSTAGWFDRGRRW